MLARSLAQHRVGNSDASLLADSESVKAKLDLLFRRWASAQTQPAVACCALSSPHPQPDRMDLVKSLKVNMVKEHSARVQVLYLVTGKGKTSKSLCSRKSSLPTKHSLLGSLLSPAEVKQT